MAFVGNQSRYGISLRSACALVFTCCAFCILASCNSATVNSSGSQDVDVLDKVRSLDILPRYPTQAGTSTTSSGPRAQPMVFQGTEVTDIATPRPQPAAS